MKRTINKYNNEPITLPALRGAMGDWYYYVTLLPFGEVASRVFLPEEIDNKYKDRENMRLEDWIQREIVDKRIDIIVDYIKKQKQHFFNSLILGIYDGHPHWQEIKLNYENIYGAKEPENIEYLERTFGILSLSGKESIFAIDGQHRAISIRKSVGENQKLESEEICVIFVAHKNDEDGKIRTRRLFATLNKYAKPVSHSEIIALSEDNNCAIITRYFVDDFETFKSKILVNKNRSINIENTNAFTNILVLHDIIEIILTNKKVYGFRVNGENYNSFTTIRADDDIIQKNIKYCKSLFLEIIDKIPSLHSFFRENAQINRKDVKANLLFKPIGQNVFFKSLKVAIEYKKKNTLINFFAKDDFNLRNKAWNKVFWDKETESIITNASRQKFATLLILEAIGIPIKRTIKDIEIYNNIGLKKEDIL